MFRSRAVVDAGEAVIHRWLMRYSIIVLKDVILVAVAMVIATTVRGGALTDSGHHSPKNK